MRKETMNTRSVEITVGLFVDGGLLALFVLAMKVSNLNIYTGKDGYEVLARFENIGGLKERSPVTMAGVRIGQVARIEFDNDTYEAVTHMEIDPSYNKLPKDTSASIFTAGLLGEQYISLEPGGEETYLGPGDEIKLTQSALVLEQVIGQFLFSKASEGGGNEK